MAYFLDPVPALDEVVARLQGVDIEAAVNTAHVNLPGAWVRWAGYDSLVLSGEEFVRVEVVLLVGAMPLDEAYRQLVALAEEAVEELGYPDGPVRQQATLFANDPVALPSLVLPYNVA